MHGHDCLSFVGWHHQSHQLEESGQLAYLGGPACDVLWRHNSAHKDAMLLPHGGISSAANWIKVKFQTYGTVIL